MGIDLLAKKCPSSFDIAYLKVNTILGLQITCCYLCLVAYYQSINLARPRLYQSNYESYTLEEDKNMKNLNFNFSVLTF
jgi:hypothetical protein